MADAGCVSGEWRRAKHCCWLAGWLAGAGAE